MFVVCSIFASLGICGSVFIAAMFILNKSEIDKKAIHDAERLKEIQRRKAQRHLSVR